MKKFLDIEILEDDLKENYKQLNNRANIMETSANYRFNINEQSLKSIQTTLESVVHIGIDVCHDPYGHSWSVICIEGKVNIVKFVDLDRNNAQGVLDFLRQFEAGSHCIDTPYQEMFRKGLFKLS